MSNCPTCQFSPKNTLSATQTSGHCYMFRNKPVGTCAQFRPLVDPQNVRSYYGSLSRYSRKQFLEK